MSSIKKIQVAASKSYLQRALAISALAKGESVLNDLSWCNDSLSAKQIVEALGASITEKDRSIRLNSNGLELKNSRFHAGESGLGIRMFSPILALLDTGISFSGEGSLNTRPVGMIEDALKQLGVKVSSKNGFLPLEITGPIVPGEIEIDGSLSSQLLTGLLIALPLAKGDTQLKVNQLKSKPYVDMTLAIMKHFGVEVEHDNYELFKIKGNQEYKATNYQIEGDWSGAAFFLVYGAVTNGIEITNLNYKSLQADKAIIEALELAGAKLSIGDSSIVVEPKELKAFELDATDCPDLFPPLVCLASQCKGTSRIKGISRLTHKESNRAEVLQKEFSKMGVKIVLKDDYMCIEGSQAKAAVIDSHNDHRIAMAGGIMNLFCDGIIEVENKEAINKSYPSFFEELKKL